ncbi:hypothetical protein CF096_03770 [Clostridium botulinum]|nr:hypothetical protein B2H85_06225 [Clostridium botulinum]RKF12045.1 hypothetical protein DWR11_05395 [Clostridium botulinum]
MVVDKKINCLKEIFIGISLVIIVLYIHIKIPKINKIKHKNRSVHLFIKISFHINYYMLKQP